MRESDFYEGLTNGATRQRGLSCPNPRCQLGDSLAEISRPAAGSAGVEPTHPEAAADQLGYLAAAFSVRSSAA